MIRHVLLCRREHGCCCWLNTRNGGLRASDRLLRLSTAVPQSRGHFARSDGRPRARVDRRRARCARARGPRGTRARRSRVRRAGPHSFTDELVSTCPSHRAVLLPRLVQLLLGLLCINGSRGGTLAEEAPPPLPSFRLSAGFSSDMVLQQAPAKAAIYGFGEGPVSITLSGRDAAGAAVHYSVAAETRQGQGDTASVDRAAATWKAFLRPSTAGGSYNVTAKGANGKVVLSEVTFGDVYFCSGQSNMALATAFTFNHNTVEQLFQTDPRYAEKLRLFMCRRAVRLQHPSNSQNTLHRPVLLSGPVLGSWYNAADATTTVISQDADSNATAFLEVLSDLFVLRFRIAGRFGTKRATDWTDTERSRWLDY